MAATQAKTQIKFRIVFSEDLEVGPYDTEGKAKAEAAKMEAAGLTGGVVKEMLTCSSVAALILKAQADLKAQAEQVSEPETAKVAAKPTSRRAAK